jgi:hypothetical protein
LLFEVVCLIDTILVLSKPNAEASFYQFLEELNMPTIILNEIECNDPMGARDDVFLSLSTEEVTGRIIWGPQRMREGNQITLSSQVTPIEYDEFAIISLYEHDTIGDNDYLGSMALDRHETDRTADFYFPSSLNSRYRMNYEIQVVSPSNEQVHGIRLVSLTCRDAQGRRDEVTLTVNNRIVLGPRRTMKKGWTANFNDMEITFRSNCVIRLQDTQGQDWDRSFTINAGDYLLNHDENHTFDVRGSGVTGDARYILTYQMVA